MRKSQNETSNDTERSVDPILFEVIRNALVEATEEMSVSLQRTAFSTNVKTRLDYSCAFVDAEGRMIAQAFCQPAHLVTIGRLVPRSVGEFGAENIEPGDMLIVNDPHRQASHLNDIFLIAPFYHRGELVGYLSNICHHVDVGGGAPASIGAFRETYQEGIILPVVKIVAAGEIEAGVWKMILANVRAKKEVAGDLRAQISAINLGLRRLGAVLDRYGLDTVRFYIQELLDYTEKRTRAELAKLPQGTFEAEGWLDDDGISDRPVHLKARVILDGRRAMFDFEGTDAQRWAPMNSNLTQTFTACVYVLKCLIDPDVPINEGFYQPIEVSAPEGSAVNARHPGAIVGGWEVSVRVCEVLFKAFSQAMPDKVPAGTKGMICHVGFGGEDPRTGDYYTFLETLAGGYGGRIRSDGPDAVQTHIQNTQNAPVEETELNYPVRVARYSLIPDSEGPGRFRGGLGLCREYVFPDHEPIFTTLADRARFAPVGTLRRRRRAPGALPQHHRRRGRVHLLQGHGPRRERSHDPGRDLRGRRLRSGAGARPGAGAHRRDRGEDQRGARPRRLRCRHRHQRRFDRHRRHERAPRRASGGGEPVMSEQFRLGVDIGGTFTDAVLLSEASGATRIAKVPSTPSDPSRGFLDAVDRILSDGNVAPDAISYLVHGTTVATNSLIEGKTPRTAFITTEGFRDMLEIGRQVRPTLYDVHFEKPRPLVPRNLCFEVGERLDAGGAVLKPLDEDRVHEIARTLAEQEVVSVAVCLLHGYLNPVHEQRIGELLRTHNQELVISLSSDVCPEFREYFRASTTIINACVRPVLARYLDDIEKRLRGHGMTAELLIMQSSGGVLTFETGAEKPAYMVESGPAAGVIVANYIAGELGYANAISFDMGGTTAKVGLILDGRPRVTKEYEVGAQANPGVGQSRASGYPIRTPVIDLVEIGAGGGSIAWVDSGGILRVGPQSAGADPGPICYGHGGEDPAITDANLVLGRLDPAYFLGGEMGLNVDAARDGIARRCAEPMKMDAVACANGIVEIANAAMTNALRVMTVQRGIDPRELVMVAFGGAGPLHAGRLCEEMNIGLLIVPPSPGTASALGLLVTDLKHEFSRTPNHGRGRGGPR